MKCPEYRRFCMGEIPLDEFAAHRESCAECREAATLDEIIECRAQQLPAPASAPGLWTRIAHRLEQEQSAPRWKKWLERLPWVDVFDPRRQMVWRYAAALVVVAVVGIVALQVLRPAEPMPRNLLTEKALERVESLEVEYEMAIGELETIAAPMIAAADTELMLRYRDRLETIDTHIRRCRAVLAEDGANAHVRRYLLAAYRDKKETLTQLLALADG
ncbi:MAG: hypothetical protein KAW17_12705 [Candidatus Eisenbacteria sp.]|nr:hypothetical protein [Candidatus Eisenbacteria bacterium]